MKKSILLFFLISLSNALCYSQHYTDVYEFKSLQFDSCMLDIDVGCNAFNIQKKPDVGFDIIVREEPFSKGTVRKSNAIIHCYDRKLKRMYVFKQINDSTLEAMKHTAVFVKGDKIHKVLSVLCDTP
jgi:hypothetical protein